MCIYIKLSCAQLYHLIYVFTYNTVSDVMHYGTICDIFYEYAYIYMYIYIYIYTCSKYKTSQAFLGLFVLSGSMHKKWCALLLYFVVLNVFALRHVPT